MKTLRLGLSVVSLVLLGVGYAGSQVAALNGWVADWALKVDQPLVVALSLTLLAAAVILSIVREPHEGAS